MSEQERKQIEARHAEVSTDMSRCYSAVCALRAHKDRGTLLQLLRESEARAERAEKELATERAAHAATIDMMNACKDRSETTYREEIGRLQKELARFQRADVGERVREFESMRRTGIVLGDYFWELLDICRQQAARVQELEEAVASWMREHVEQDLMIEKQEAEIAKLRTHNRELLTNTEPLHVLASAMNRMSLRARAWKRCAKKWRHDHKIDNAQLNRDIADLQDQLHDALEDLTDQQNKRHEAEQKLAAFEDAPTDRHELLDPVESCQQLEKSEELAAPEEAFRTGLPPVALRKVCATWGASEGCTVIFAGEACRYRYEHGEHGVWEDDTVGDPSEWDGVKFMPLNTTWSQVEQAAARALGAEDAKAGLERNHAWGICELVGVTAPGRGGPAIRDRARYRAGFLKRQYDAAYDAAKAKGG